VRIIITSDTNAAAKSAMTPDQSSSRFSPYRSSMTSVQTRSAFVSPGKAGARIALTPALLSRAS
jgi:hypothetical protein